MIAVQAGWVAHHCTVKNGLKYPSSMGNWLGHQLDVSGIARQGNVRAHQIVAASATTHNTTHHNKKGR
jgi:hypothetical protein